MNKNMLKTQLLSISEIFKAIYSYENLEGNKFK